MLVPQSKMADGRLRSAAPRLAKMGFGFWFGQGAMLAPGTEICEAVQQAVTEISLYIN